MSALTHLRGPRRTNPASNGGEERIIPRLQVPNAFGVVTGLLCSPEEAAQSVDVETQMSKSLLDDRSKGKLRDYTSALHVLDSVNVAFSDLLAKVDESESIRDEMAAECDTQHHTIQQLRFDLDAAERRSDDVERQNAELGDKLIAEAHRASTWEQNASQADKSLAETQRHIDDLTDVCKTLHDGIYTIFGTNSPIQKAMTSLGKDQ